VKVALEERVREGKSDTMAQKSTLPMAPQRATVPSIPNLGASPGVRPGFCGAAETRVGILQYRPDLAPVGKSIDWYGEYLQPQLDLLARIIRPGATVMEVGAGIGVHAVFLATLLGDEGHLFVYESDALLQRILRQNLEANGARNVTLMRRMLAGPQGGRAEQDTAASIVADVANAPTSAPMTETLDELQLEKLHLLKINDRVSGMEILAGTTEALWRLRPLLFIAAHDDAALHELSMRVKEFSYRCWRMETALFNPENFNRRDNDIFDGATALALLAIPEEIDVDVTLNRCIELS